MNYSRVILVGRLTADPELKSTPSGKSVATFRLATDRVWTDQQGKKNEATEFHNIVL
jgi:single-strand DNA-binding protein